MESVDQDNRQKQLANITHEINNAAGFVSCNIETLRGYFETFQQLLHAYETLGALCLNGDESRMRETLRHVSQIRKREDLAFILDDITPLFNESNDGMKRIVRSVQHLRGLRESLSNGT